MQMPGTTKPCSTLPTVSLPSDLHQTCSSRPLRCDALQDFPKTPQRLIVGAICERQKVERSFNQLYPLIGIRDSSSPNQQKFDLLTVIIWRRHGAQAVQLG